MIVHVLLHLINEIKKIDNMSFIINKWNNS